MANGIDFDAIRPTSSTADLDLANAIEVPANVVARFKTTRGLGKTVKRETGGRYMVRTIDGKVLAIPVK